MSARPGMRADAAGHRPGGRAVLDVRDNHDGSSVKHHRTAMGTVMDSNP
jgi:hypothetical protein